MRDHKTINEKGGAEIWREFKEDAFEAHGLACSVVLSLAQFGLGVPLGASYVPGSPVF